MSQEQTYTKEQLEALRDCRNRGPCAGCVFDKEYECIKSGEWKEYIASDLLSANEEIERLRVALKDIGEYNGEGLSTTPWKRIVAEIGKKARDALKGD